MKIDKDQILDLLHGSGKHDEADRANSALPDTVDTDDPKHSDLLSKLGLDIEDIKGKLGGLGKFV
jgi:hypothetical protein